MKNESSDKKNGAELQYLRQQKGVKQDTLAKKLRVRASYISKIETQ